MENQSNGPSSPGHSLAISHVEHDSLEDQYDGDEELLLLQMEQTGNEPISPNLKAVMDSNREPDRPEKDRTTPLLLARPQSSGLDISGFSFARPVPRGKPLLPQPSTRQSFSAHGAISREQTNKDDMSDKVNGPKQTNSIHPAPDMEPKTYPVHNPDGSHQNTTRPYSPFANPPQRSKAASRTSLANYETFEDTSSDQLHGGNNAAAQPGGRRQRMGTEQMDQEHTTSETTQKENNEKSRGASVIQIPVPPSETVNGDRVPRSPSLGPTSDGFRVSKRRAGNGKKSASMKQPVPVNLDKEGGQLSEEDLFQLLIHRMRIREETEIAALNLHKQMQANIFELTEENESLKTQLEAISTQLQRSKSDSKAHKAQIENWKAKLGKFKGFLNELGAEYQNLRKENHRLKEVKESLDSERIEIKSEIEDARQQVSKTANILSARRNQLSETENMIASMTLALRNAEEKTKFIQDQLTEEKRRSSILEAYIQNSSRAQTKQLGLIRNDQLEIANRFKSASEALSQKLDASQAETLSTLGATFESCFSLLKEVRNELSVGKADVQQCNEIALKVSSCMKSFECELNKTIERNSELNEKMECNINAQLRLAEGSENYHSALLKQLGITEEQYKALQETFEELGPSIHKFHSSVVGLEEKENSLAQQIDHLEKSLSEAQIPSEMPIPATEICNLTVENSSLKSQIQHLSEELSSMEGTVRVKEQENEETRNVLLETMAKVQEAEKRASDFESKVIDLQEKIKSTEAEVREELSRASVISRDQVRARFEQQLHGLLREKAEAEKEMDKVQKLLSETRKSLAESEDSAKRQRDEMEALLLEREQQIRSLEDFRIQDATRMEQCDGEMRLLQQAEASAVEQQKSLVQQLDEANGRIAELNGTVSSKHIEAEDLQKKLDSLHGELLKKEEECGQIRKELYDANTARSSLETGKAKAKAEIHALLKRLQDSERWMNGIKEAINRSRDLPLEGTLPGTWDRLKDYLGLPNVSNNPSPSSDGRNYSHKAGVIGDVDASHNTQSTLTPTKVCETPVKGVIQTTEFIFRTQSVQSGNPSSPVQHEPRAGDSYTAGGTASHCANSNSSNEIVPFSNIRQQLSPELCSSLSPEPSELADMLDLTLQNEMTRQTNEQATVVPSLKDIDSIPKAGNQASPGPQRDLLVMEPPAGSANVEETREKQKAVTFAAGDQGIGSEKRKFSATLDSHAEESTFEKRAIEGTERTTRRTYSRSQRSSSKGYARGSNQPSASSAGEGANQDNQTEQYTSNDKRARVSMASSYSRTRKQTEGVSEYFERRGSPASLASGSSRQLSTNGSNPKNHKWTRGAKRGRKTRGDRYNARFSQEIS